MSRMERNKQLHKKLAQEEKSSTKENMFARKTRGQKKASLDATSTDYNPNDEEIDHSEMQSTISNDSGGHQQQFRKEQSSLQRKEDTLSQQVQPKKGKAKQPKSPKSRKRRKHPVIKILFRLLIVLLIYSVGAFLVGQQVAKSDTSVSKSDEETFNGVTSATGNNNLLLIGSDSREGETGRADSIMILQLGGPMGTPKLVSFMRDTLVTIPGYGENKINAAYAFGGAELVRQTLALNFGIDTKYYTEVNFQSFEKVIDTLFPSGVAIDAEKDMSDYLEVAIQKGQQQMNGLELLQYARFRMDEEGDFGRVRRQQQVIDAIFSEMKNPVSIVKLPYATGKVLGYATTDLPMTFLLKNMLSIARGAGGIERLTIPVDNSWQYGNSATAGSVLVVDFQTNQQAISDFFN